MKFGQLIEYNMKNIFVKKSYTKYTGETIPRPLSKKLKLSKSQNQKSKVLNSFLLLCATFRTSSMGNYWGWAKIPKWSTQDFSIC